MQQANNYYQMVFLVVAATAFVSIACSQHEAVQPQPTPAPTNPLDRPESPSREASDSPEAGPLRISAGDYDGLPAISVDGRRIAIATNPAFSGIAVHQYVVMLDAQSGRVVNVYRTYGQDGVQVEAVNDALASGRFASLTAVVDTFPEPSREERPTGSRFALTLAYLDEVDLDAPLTRRGQLLEGFRKIDLTVEDALSHRTWRAHGLSYEPPAFESIPRNCRAAFFPAMIRIWGSAEHPTLLVEQVWGSGSGECSPWRFVLLGQSNGDGMSEVAEVEERTLRPWPRSGEVGR